jgi:putative membrane protein
MKRHFVMGAAVLAAVSIGTAWADSDEHTKRFDSQESAFLREAAQTDVFEERMGQYAAEHAAMDETKQLGRQLATDHEADLKTIEQLASDHGLDLTKHDNDLSPQQKETYDKLTTRSGAAFDKDYTKLVLAQHNRIIAEYMREKDHAADVAVREYADKSLPMLKQHKDMAAQAEKDAWK